MIKKLLHTAVIIICLSFPFFLTGCIGIPEGVEAVDGFDIRRYTGTWYEIARLDHRFERGLSNVCAEYALREDDGIDVVNRGYDDKNQKWEEVKGRGYFVGDSTVGRLKVSFFGPFYAGYNVIALDKQDYSYAVVCGPDRSFFWILGRTPKIPANTLHDLLNFAQESGFDTQHLVYPKHDQWRSSIKLN